MALATVLKGIYRELTGSQREVDLGATREGGLHVAQRSAPYVEITRQGQMWSVMNTSALAALVVRPSTVANLTLHNLHAEGGPSLVIVRAFFFNLVSTAAQARSGLWLCSHQKAAAPTASIVVVKGATGTPNSDVAAQVVAAVAATVVDDGWFPWGDSVDLEPTGVLPGTQKDVDVRGLLVVPPGRSISTQVVSGVVGNTFTTGFMYYKAQLDLG